MKIAILSRSPRSYSTRRLKKAAQERGHKVKVLDTLGLGVYLQKGDPHLTYKGKPVGLYDAVIPRIGASITFFGTAVVRQFEQMGVFCLNSSFPISVARDKLRSLQVLSRHDIGIPQTAFVRDKADVLSAIEKVGGAPVIIKLLEGTQGVGVILAETTKTAEAIVETLQSANQNVLIQKFVSESKGKDIRALVVGDRVVAAMRRQAVGHEFRSNVHRGGITKAVHLDRKYERTAVEAVRILGLRLAGVDMLEGQEGPQIMEVNSSPGLEGIEKASGVDVAAEAVKYLEEHVQFQDLDLRERMSLATGYGVAEITIGSESLLVGKELADTGLREQDIVVMSITRDGIPIANPSPTREVLPGDILLCYGKRITMKNLLSRPQSSRKRRKK